MPCTLMDAHFQLNFLVGSLLHYNYYNYYSCFGHTHSDSPYHLPSRCVPQKITVLIVMTVMTVMREK